MRTKMLGEAETLKALKDFTPDLGKALTTEMASYLKPITAKARGYIPAESTLSGWATQSEGSYWKPREFNAAQMRAGIKYSTTRTKLDKHGFRSYARIQNKSAAGAIYETAGRKNYNGQPWTGGLNFNDRKTSHSANKNAGSQFIKAMPPLVQANVYGSKGGSLGRYAKGRAIYRAFKEDGGKADKAINAAIYSASAQFMAIARGR